MTKRWGSHWYNQAEREEKTGSRTSHRRCRECGMFLFTCTCEKENRAVHLGPESPSEDLFTLFERQGG